MDVLAAVHKTISVQDPCQHISVMKSMYFNINKIYTNSQIGFKIESINLSMDWNKEIRTYFYSAKLCCGSLALLSAMYCHGNKMTQSVQPKFLSF